ncbi:MAG: phospholipase D-like domain-containing protein [Verrucomicrobiia bacterium]
MGTWLDRNTGTRQETGTVRLLIDGEKFFPEFERRMAEAQHSINVPVCIFDRDDVAVQMADQLKEHSTNVEVKVMFDRLTSGAAGRAPPTMPMADDFVPPRSIAAYLRSGSKVQVRPLLNPGFTADHTKVFIIDNRYAYLGGMNLGREYRYEWHDLMVEVQGPVVASFQRQFCRSSARIVAPP